MRKPLLLLSFLFNGLANSGDCSALLKHSWIDREYTLHFIEALIDASPDDFEKVSGVSAEGFSELPSSHDYSYTLHTSSNKGVVFYRLKEQDELIGVLILSFRKNEIAEVVGSAEFLKIRPEYRDRGIGANLILRRLPHFYKRLGVYKEEIEVGWEGRAYWPKGYVFSKEHSFKENSKTLSQAELVRNNFRRFLSHHKLYPSDLYLLKENEKIPLDETLSHLKEAVDYLNVYHKEGKKILTEAYYDAGKLSEPKEMSVGLSFTLTDYRPREGQRVRVFQGDKALSDIGMPTWIGRRDFSEEN